MDPAEFVKGWNYSRTHMRWHLPIEEGLALLSARESNSPYPRLQCAWIVAMVYLILKTRLRSIGVRAAKEIVGASKVSGIRR